MKKTIIINVLSFLVTSMGFANTESFEQSPTWPLDNNTNNLSDMNDKQMKSWDKWILSGTLGALGILTIGSASKVVMDFYDDDEAQVQNLKNSEQKKYSDLHRKPKDSHSNPNKAHEKVEQFDESNNIEKVDGKLWLTQAKKASNRMGNNMGNDHILTPKMFVNLLDKAILQARNFLGDAQWYNSKINFEKDFTPYVQKLTLNESDIVSVHGDFHGDVASLSHMLDQLRSRNLMDGFKLNDNFHMLFLGDYTDRGQYGIDVLATVILLKLNNPTKVWLARGNHEDLNINLVYGLYSEIESFIEGSEITIGEITSRLNQFYNILPVAIFLGNSSENRRILCNHGGIEPGFDHKPLLSDKRANLFAKISDLDRKTFYKTHKKHLDNLFWQNYSENKVLEENLSSGEIGFMWNDFTFDKEDRPSQSPRGAVTFGYQDTLAYLGKEIAAIFRAHQHESYTMDRMDEHGGIFQHWVEASERGNVYDFNLKYGMVFTFTVSPDSMYGERYGVNFDSFGLLTLPGKFENWHLEVIRKDFNFNN